MKLAQLSESSGASTATIKYYLREALLRPGDRVHTTQMHYDEHHLPRLRLIRALTDVGGLSIEMVRDVLTARETPDLTPGELVSACHVAPACCGTASEHGADHAAAMSEIVALAHRQGWRVSYDTPAVVTAAGALDALRSLGQAGTREHIDAYAQAAETVTAADLRTTRATTSQAIKALVVTSVLGDVLLSALRRLAQIHHLHDEAPARITALSNSAPGQ
ncbi:MerR family transcriptional regulator [Streptomyces sp. NPDC021356]|uniref:MerR family transcriptional regulator n=1 Tax=Streptomyces sp. NPDC021356 TaxID=3154900 RepID=UPI0033E418C8